MSARGGIRTHEAAAVDLKSTPFDRSGIQPEVPTPNDGEGTNAPYRDRTYDLAINSRTL